MSLAQDIRRGEVTIRHLSKSYKLNGSHLQVLKDINLHIRSGESLAIVGASGSGKTTLLRVLAGLEESDTGEVIVDGKAIRGVGAERAVIFQEPRLLPWLDVLGNVAFGLETRGLTGEQARARARHYVKLVGLQQFEAAYPRQLSGGMAQRVGIARALAVQPEILLLDEPLGALDKKLREETQFELMDLQQSLGLTFVVVTHDQEEAMTMADRIAVMSHGKVVQVATPAEIYEAPNSRFVADFIGDVNIFDGKVTTSGNGATRDISRQRIHHPHHRARRSGDRQHGRVCHPPREDPRQPRGAGERRGQRGQGRDLGYRLSRRHDRLPYQAGERPVRQSLFAQCTALRRRPLHL